VEWFFTREDLCRATVALHAMARQPGLLPVREIMALELQLPFNAEGWRYVGFKGDSELGVLSGMWLAEAGGRPALRLHRRAKQPDRRDQPGSCGGGDGGEAQPPCQDALSWRRLVVQAPVGRIERITAAGWSGCWIVQRGAGSRRTKAYFNGVSIWAALMPLTEATGEL
jgi:hypothetical protein